MVTLANDSIVAAGTLLNRLERKFEIMLDVAGRAFGEP